MMKKRVALYIDW